MVRRPAATACSAWHTSPARGSDGRGSGRSGHPKEDGGFRRSFAAEARVRLRSRGPELVWPRGGSGRPPPGASLRSGSPTANPTWARAGGVGGATGHGSVWACLRPGSPNDTGIWPRISSGCARVSLCCRTAVGVASPRADGLLGCPYAPRDRRRARHRGASSPAQQGVQWVERAADDRSVPLDPFEQRRHHGRSARGLAPWR